MAAFFSQVGYKPTGEWKEEIVYFDPAFAPARLGTARQAIGRDAAARGGSPDGTTRPPGTRTEDPREVFADWLTAPQNPWFARSIANRAWFWLLGRGIIHEPDDIRPDNPPRIPELLACLERELVAARYDLKHLFRLILNSSDVPAVVDPPVAAAGRGGAHFAHYTLRRLEAEVLIDALNQVTGMSDRCWSGQISFPHRQGFASPARRARGR